MLNQANLQNLGILDQQYGRQQQALSNTKATAQAALNSISAKYLQNQAENRTLQTYENLYNYRFDPRFRAMNMNPLAQFNTDLSGFSSEQLKALAKVKEEEETKKDKTTKKNGGLVRAIKSM
jgi:long-subunit acyl-CoA synthetase (AMP-forming)